MILHCIALHCIALHCIALHCIVLHYIALHCIALHCIALHCIALHCIALHCIALHCIALHCKSGSWQSKIKVGHLEMLGPEEFQYTLKGETSENVSSTLYLGVCVSETLKWEAHINKITSKANSTLGFLRRNLKACPPKLNETAYFSLVRSSLEFSSAAWDPFRQKHIDKLDKIQRTTAIFVTQNYRQTASVTSLIQSLGWTDLKTKRKNSRLLCMFKILNELFEIPINDRLIPADKRTRGGHNQAYKHIRSNTTLGQNSFWHPTIPDWNSLPADAIESKTEQHSRVSWSTRSASLSPPPSNLILRNGGLLEYIFGAHPSIWVNVVCDSSGCLSIPTCP